MQEKLDLLKGKLATAMKDVSFKRVFILSGFVAFAAVIVFASVFFNVGESMAYAPLKSENFTEMMKDKGQNIEAVYKDSYAGLSKRDKDLAYIYLKDKFRGKDVSYTMYKVKAG